MTKAKSIRIGIMNLQSGVATTKGYWQYLTTWWKYVLPHSSQPIADAAKLVKKHRLDLIGLVEIDAGSFRTKQIDQLRLFAETADFSHRTFFPTITFRKHALQGNATCSRFPLLQSRNHKLPGLGEPRYLSESVVEIDSVRCTFFVTHLSLDRFHRIAQLQAVAEIVNAATGPTILVGDFNIFHDSEMQLLHESRLTMATADATFPSWKPNRYLDYIFFSEEFRIKHSEIDPTKVSDHLLFWTEVEID